MFTPSFESLVLVVYTIIQFLTPGAESVGGLSGNDSIFRASIACLDAPSGLLFIWAVSDFILHLDPNSRFRLARFGLLHMRDSHDRGTRLRISTRLSPLQFFSTSTRIAKLYVVNENDESHDPGPSNVRPVNNKEITFYLSLNSFIVPYLWQDRTKVLETRRFRLSRRLILEAGALSLTRLCHFFTICISLLATRILLIIFLFPPSWSRVVIILSELSRSSMAITQEISVFTYSCYAKGIHAWFGPHDVQFRERRKKLPPDFQANFEDKFYEFLGINYPAKLAFIMAKRLWTYQYRIWVFLALPEGLNPGEKIFSLLSIPAEEEFDKRAEARSILLKVFEERQNGDSHLYDVQFDNVPRQLYNEAMSSGLQALPILRYGLGSLLLVGLLIGLLAPVILALPDTPSHAGIYWAVEQGLVTLLKYYDFSTCRVNTAFGEPPAQVPDSEA
ncbi:hypothetical protein BGW36DRAFT_355088 [Talaromyces proteolyticus]|uniref:Uncharacterized protein n=1 Tax=Talaromyces proteolyticus TaxID=1131652 RepID=A0AAD4KY33_9EURO|nr:uncharacterized protein BGW36DRAFT_355088 [Talaromyces proteolyticus]KAH8703675.1 hypothetical protein BGW36DRAFT_355088 [Talaromyces proteolyticus]